MKGDGLAEVMSSSDWAVHSSRAIGSPGPVRVAVDAMGGDHAPGEIVKGAVQASRRGDVHVLLVGDPDRVEEELKRLTCQRAAISVVTAREMIATDEKPVQAFRSKPDASIAVALRLLAEGDADAVITAGNTGAMVVAACLILGRFEGVERPAIAIVIPAPGRRVVLLDAGVNLGAVPQQLLQFALMGSTFASWALGVREPKVALLNVGVEESKGGPTLTKAHALLARSNLNFIGNIEGDDIAAGKADVIVCDGYVGNIILKHTEGWSRAVLAMLKNEVARNPLLWPSYLPLGLAMSRVRHRLRCEQYGGAILLGVKGICIKSRGNSRATGIRNAIAAAVQMVRAGLVQHMDKGLSAQQTAASGIRGSLASCDGQQGAGQETVQP